MKTRVSAVTATICRVRPVTIAYHKDVDLWFMSSPACEVSTFYPDAVRVPYRTLFDALQWSKQLIHPLIDDDPANPQFRDNPRLELVGIRWQVFNDDDPVPFAVVDCNYNGAEVPNWCRVRVPSIEVSEYFQTLKSALDFCQYLSKPYSLKLDTEANMKKC